MPMKVGLSTGRWNEQEFEIVLVGPAFLNRSTLSTLNFFFVNLDMCFFECLLVDCNTNFPEYFFQAAVFSTEISVVIIQFELFL